MTKPCKQCKHCEIKNGVAGGFYCNKKKALTSIARITDKDGNYADEECFDDEEVKNENP
ncbi:MAG: hypothetical protein KTR16_11320 [Acidiferrobacterales bacterium]|nr:hypothetical protein [Acidiferrobacterales bacterium]